MPVVPLHATCLTIGVAFLSSACMLAAPGAWVCALAVMAIELSASAAAANVKVSLFINPPPVCRMPNTECR
jgi:hypothetical protein